MIELKDLSIGYKSKRATNNVFKHIQLDLTPGTLVGLIGDNGIGKSTLLKTITGDLLPLSGEVILNKKNVQEYSSQELAQLLSIVVTDTIGGFNLTVWDVVSLGRTPYINVFGKLTAHDETIITQSLEQLSVLNLKDKLVEELSDGQRQKVMIAKSLAQQTPIIILDEPTAFLDYTSKHQLFSILKTLCEEQNKLILVSSHDIDLMMKYISKSVTLQENNRISVR